MKAAEWTAAIMARARPLGTIPRYGDPDWQALPPSDPRFVAAVAVAAECWRHRCDPATIARDLRDQLDAEQQTAEKLEAEDFAALAGQVRRLAAVPSREELRRRRGEPA